MKSWLGPDNRPGLAVVRPRGLVSKEGRCPCFLFRFILVAKGRQGKRESRGLWASEGPVQVLYHKPSA